MSRAFWPAIRGLSGDDAETRGVSLPKVDQPPFSWVVVGWVLSKKAKFFQMVGQSFSGNAQLTGRSTHIPASSPWISCSFEDI